MDLRLFHATENPDRDYTRFDRYNSWTRRQPCRLLEWTGWYASSVPLRLLGHYRLYQIYRQSFRRGPVDLPEVHGYILQYRNFHGIKFSLATLLSHFPAWLGYPDKIVEIQAINRILIYDQVAVLQEFLINADTDFESALRRALQQIRDPAFLNPGSTTRTQHPNVFVQVRHNHHTINNTAYHQLNFQSVIKQEVAVKETAPAKEAVSGKEKGVFSKKQILILFDMLNQSAKLERIDLSKPNKLDAIAQFFQAVTGKGKETWLETLKDYRNKDLYEFHTSGERNQLLITLTNLSEITRAAGFRAVSNLIDKKIRDIETKQ
jgi:hypothetical protein